MAETTCSTEMLRMLAFPSTCTPLSENRKPHSSGLVGPNNPTDGMPQRSAA